MAIFPEQNWHTTPPAITSSRTWLALICFNVGRNSSKESESQPEMEEVCPDILLIPLPTGEQSPERSLGN